MTDLLYSEYESDGSLVLFRCSECGQLDLSIGSLHGHIEKHRGYTRFGIQLPFTKESPGNYGELMDMTEVVLVEETTEIDPEEVEGL